MFVYIAKHKWDRSHLNTRHRRSWNSQDWMSVHNEFVFRVVGWGRRCLEIEEIWFWRIFFLPVVELDIAPLLAAGFNDSEFAGFCACLALYFTTSAKTIIVITVSCRRHHRQRQQHQLRQSDTLEKVSFIYRISTTALYCWRNTQVYHHCRRKRRLPTAPSSNPNIAYTKWRAFGTRLQFNMTKGKFSLVRSRGWVLPGNR